MRDDTQWLLDIIEAIERIERYSSRGRDAFETDELIQNWIVHPSFRINGLISKQFR